MWNSFLHWLHHLFNPHCDFCREDAKCPNCELLTRLFESERTEKTRLLHLLTDKPVEPVMDVKDLPKPVMTRPVPWHIKRAELEKQSREIAEQKRQEERVQKEITSVPSIEELEVKALGETNG